MIRLLLVDDQPLIWQGIKAMLAQELDLQVVGTADNGEAAIQQVEALQPDVVLMDLRMPVMNGKDATRAIAQRFPDVKVLVLSTYDDDRDIAESMRAGAKGYLLKDMLSEELAQAIRLVYRGHTHLGPGLLEKLITSVPSSEANGPEPVPDELTTNKPLSQQPPDPHQRQNIDESSIEGSQLGQAGRDSIQNQGPGSVFKDVTVNMFGQQEESARTRLTRQEYHNRQALLSKVSNFWVKSVLETSLHCRALIELGLEERPGAVANPWNMVWETGDGPEQSLPSSAKAIEIFDQLGKGRTLLILGEPGAGKTTTLLELARDLITRAEQDINQSIPVVFNLSSWLGEKQTIADWLVKELITKYQVPKETGQTWIRKQQLLLLLDGLDEVRAECREACILALNKFNQDFGPEIVVCSRIKDYEALSNRLSFQGAVYLRSLTLEQVRHSLASTGPELAGLSALIQGDTALQELAKSPLILNIMILAYQGVSAEDLPITNLVEERRRHLLSTYVERMFKRRGVSQPYSEKQARHWLIWLAQRMTQSSQTVFLIEQMQLSWVQTEAQKKTYRIGVRLIIGLLAGVLHEGLLAGLYLGPMGLIWGLIGGSIAGLLYALTDGLSKLNASQEATPGEPLSREWHLGFIGMLSSGLMFGLIFGLSFGLIFGLGFGLAGGLKFGLVYGLVYALFGGLLYQLIRKEIEPADTLKRSWAKARDRFIFGLVLGPILTPVAGLADGMIYGLLIGLILSVTLGFEKGIEVDRIIVPNQGIWKSATAAINAAIIVVLFSGLLLGVLGVWFPKLAVGTIAEPVKGVLYGLANGLIFGLIGGLFAKQGSGIVCIKHFMLRFVLWQNGYIPWNYAHFLDYSAERIFLQKVGGGYIFIHRLLLEHFAAMGLDRKR
ncbi:MAG: response regulator [Chroococcidiopsidaceae cyanobacterium CP_BM_RX_35]|nr:response regulator [Chroococcidiopsidaceae cyanobacterium CP_BM_RX_35]